MNSEQLQKDSAAHGGSRKNNGEEERILKETICLCLWAANQETSQMEKAT